MLEAMDQLIWEVREIVRKGGAEGEVRTGSAVTGFYEPAPFLIGAATRFPHSVRLPS